MATDPGWNDEAGFEVSLVSSALRELAEFSVLPEPVRDSDSGDSAVGALDVSSVVAARNVTPAVLSLRAGGVLPLVVVAS